MVIGGGELPPIDVGRTARQGREAKGAGVIGMPDIAVPSAPVRPKGRTPNFMSHGKNASFDKDKDYNDATAAQEAFNAQQDAKAATPQDKLQIVRELTEKQWLTFSEVSLYDKTKAEPILKDCQFANKAERDAFLNRIGRPDLI